MVLASACDTVVLLVLGLAIAVAQDVPYKDDQLIVGLEQDADPPRLESLGLKLNKRFRLRGNAKGNFATFSIKDGERAVRKLQRLRQRKVPGVAFYELDVEWDHQSIAVVPQEYASTKHWHLQQTRAVEAWQDELFPSLSMPDAATQTLACIIDTGVQQPQIDVRSLECTVPIKQQFNTATNSATMVCNKPSDTNPNPIPDTLGHGTQMSALIAGIGTTSDRWSGDAVGVFPGVRLAACSVASGLSTFTSEIAGCIYWAVQQGCDVVNLPWAPRSRPDPISAAILTAVTAANNAGVMIVTSSGNNKLDLASRRFWPASFPGDFPCQAPLQLTVGAFDQSRSSVGPSNWGRNYVHFLAPGVAVTATNVDNNPVSVTGTSVACSLTTGAVAILTEIGKTLCPSSPKIALATAVKDSLLRSAYATAFATPFDSCPLCQSSITKGSLDIVRSLQNLREALVPCP